MVFARKTLASGPGNGRHYTQLTLICGKEMMAQREIPVDFGMGIGYKEEKYCPSS